MTSREEPTEGEKMAIRDVYESPPSATDAEAEAQTLLDDIQQIEADLGQHRRYDQSGRMLTLQEFEAWRPSAKVARSKKMSRYRYLKSWIRQQQALHPEEQSDRNRLQRLRYLGHK